MWLLSGVEVLKELSVYLGGISSLILYIALWWSVDSHLHLDHGLNL